MRLYTKLLYRIEGFRQRLRGFVDRKADTLIFIPIIIYTLVFSGYTVFMHYAFKTYAWDLGIFTQALWTTLNTDKLLYYTLELPVNPSGNFLGTHFSPVLFLILPIYALYQSPLTLLVFQSFILAVGALPLYWIARDRFKDRLTGLVFATAYLLHPALHGVNCFDFHTEALIPTFFLFGFYYIDKEEWIKGLTFIILTLSTIEFAPILVLFYALYLGLRRISNSKGAKIELLLGPISLAILSLLWFFLALRIPVEINPLKGTGLPGNWDPWGTSLNQVVVNVITNPMKAIAYMVTPVDKVFYIISLFAPLLGLPILAPLQWLLPLPWLLAALLSDYSPYFNFYFQYSGFIIAQVFVAGIYGVQKLFPTKNFSSQEPRINRKVVVSILLSSLVISCAISPIGLPALTTRKVEITPHTNQIHNVLALIPSDASVASQNDIQPHLAQREHTYVLTWPMKKKVDFIIVDIESAHFLVGQSYRIAPDQALVKAVEDQGYGLMASADGVLLFKRNYTGALALFVPKTQFFTYRQLRSTFLNSKVRVDDTSVSGRVIVHEPSDSLGFVWTGPYKYFFTGNYSATFRIKTNSKNISFKIDVVIQYGREILAKRTLGHKDFDALGQWQEFTLQFKLDGLHKLEFRGYCSSNNTRVSVDYVKVVQEDV